LGSYEELIAAQAVDAIYIPLPNHLHVPWSLKALQAGKHVLCEKPIALTSAEAQTLVDAAKRYPRLKVMEAFMYRFHPQWQRAKQLIRDGKIGELKTGHSVFSYYNIDPNNIRNIANIGGGGLMDIGCYNISSLRFIFGKEPPRVFGTVEYDPNFKTDRLASGILDLAMALPPSPARRSCRPSSVPIFSGPKGASSSSCPSLPLQTKARRFGIIAGPRSMKSSSIRATNMRFNATPSRWRFSTILPFLRRSKTPLRTCA
jgi:predicted dehydrogenase